jgi:hypothetical protein
MGSTGEKTETKNLLLHAVLFKDYAKKKPKTRVISSTVPEQVPGR